MTSPSTRRRRPARRKKPGVSLAAVPVALLALLAVTYWYITLPLLTAAIGAVGLLGYRRWSRRRGVRARDALRLYSVDPHRLGPNEFEHYLAHLCRRDGCTNVRVVGGANDLAADVLYTAPDGRRCLIQAKRYQAGNRVGSEHVQCVNGTYRDAHGCVQAAIVTTSSYTAAATAFGGRVGIRLVDAQGLARWMANGATAAPWN